MSDQLPRLRPELRIYDAKNDRTHTDRGLVPGDQRAPWAIVEDCLVYFTTEAAEAVMAAPAMCTNIEHRPGQHGPGCVPPADPANPALRLLRAIYGLCIYCDRTDDHDHAPNLAGLDLVGIPVSCWGTNCGATIQLRTDHRWYDFGTAQRHTCHDAKNWPEGTRP